MKENTEESRGKLSMVQKIKEKLNGTAKILGIAIVCISLFGSMFTSIRTYAKLDFISEQSVVAIEKQEKKFDTACTRIEQTEKNLSNEEIRSKMKDEQIDNTLKEIKDDLREIKVLLRQMSK